MAESKSAGASHSTKMTHKAAVAASSPLDKPPKPDNPLEEDTTFEDRTFQILDEVINDCVIAGISHSALHNKLIAGRAELAKMFEEEQSVVEPTKG